MKSNDDIKRDLLIVFPYIQFAIEEARKNGEVKLGILSYHENGTGKVECRFDISFIEELGQLIDAPELTEETRIKCKARKFGDELGLK